MKTLGKLITRLRAEAGWTIAELSERCPRNVGASVPSLSRLENGTACGGDISLGLLTYMAQAFGISRDDLEELARLPDLPSTPVEYVAYLRAKSQ